MSKQTCGQPHTNHRERRPVVRCALRSWAALSPMPMVGSKVRPTRPLPVFDGSSSIVKSPQKATEHNPLLIIGTVPPQLTFLRISDDGCSLLFSKMPNAEVADCSRVIPLSELRAVTVLSRHSFELKVVLPGLSVRLETHECESDRGEEHRSLRTHS